MSTLYIKYAGARGTEEIMLDSEVSIEPSISAVVITDRAGDQVVVPLDGVQSIVFRLDE